MKKEFLKQNKGITLIALVITIIVLLILAGVAISMLSGENGILKQAASAKIEQEAAQKKEETSLIDMEVLMDFKTADKSVLKTVKFKNNYLTGVEMEKNKTNVVTKIKDLNLPTGYEVWDVNNEQKIQDNEQTLKTGMIIKKVDKTVGRIVVFGDVNCDGVIDDQDKDSILLAIESKQSLEDENYKDYQIVAMDVNHDGKINEKDAIKLVEYPIVFSDVIVQNAYAYCREDLEIQFNKDIVEQYVEKIPNEFKTAYNLTVSKSGSVRITIDESAEVTVGEVLTKLNHENAYIYLAESDEDIDDKDSAALVENLSRICVIQEESGYTVKILIIVV